MLRLLLIAAAVAIALASSARAGDDVLAEYDGSATGEFLGHHRMAPT